MRPSISTRAVIARFFRKVISLVYDQLVLFFALLSAFRGPRSSADAFKWAVARSRARADVSPEPVVWIHGVSAGEIKVAAALARILQQVDPNVAIVISASTSSGLDAARKVIAATEAVLMPFDTRSAMKQMILKLRPRVIVLIESELWPQLLLAARDQNVPVLIASSKLSDRTYSRLQKVSYFAQKLLSLVTIYYAQDALTMNRLISLGVPEHRVCLTGNLKLLAPGSTKPVSAERRNRRQEKRRFVTFANLHPDEITLLSPVIKSLQSRVANGTIFLVPRHPEKFTEKDVATHFDENLTFVSNASDELLSHNGLIWVNVMGVLADIYHESDIAIVGGTFCNVGGHDLVEPLHHGAIAIYGPRVEKQRSLHSALQGRHYAVQVKTANELEATLTNFLLHDDVLDLLLEESEQAFLEFNRMAEPIVAKILDS